MNSRKKRKLFSGKNSGKDISFIEKVSQINKT